MTFQNIVVTDDDMPAKHDFGRAKPKKVTFPLADLAANPGTGFVITVEQLAELKSSYCRVMVHKFNKKHGTNFTCNKLPDGSMRVINPPSSQPKAIDLSSAEIVDTLQRSVTIAEQRNEQRETASVAAPSKEQFINWITSYLKPGMSYIFPYDYAHLFADMQSWIAELDDYDSEVTYNPPQLKIKRS